MSCGIELLLTKVTREPTATVISRGDTTPDELMVMVLVATGGVVGVGVGVGVGDGEAEPPPLPPHAAASAAIRRTFGRC